jgi:hypothetical protein
MALKFFQNNSITGAFNLPNSIAKKKKTYSSIAKNGDILLKEQQQ